MQMVILLYTEWYIQYSLCSYNRENALLCITMIALILL